MNINEVLTYLVHVSARGIYFEVDIFVSDFVSHSLFVSGGWGGCSGWVVGWLRWLGGWVGTSLMAIE